MRAGPASTRTASDEFVAGEEIADFEGGGFAASEPCVQLHWMLVPKSLRMVPGAALAGSVAPMVSRHFGDGAFGFEDITTTFPELMKSVSSPKKGRSRCTA